MAGRRHVVWLWGIALAAIAYAPALLQWDKSGWGDWQQFHHWWEVGRVAILRWGELPLWDPHHCGGVSMWGQPQSQHLAPTWWVTGLPFGTVHGHKLFILLHAVAGFTGMFTLARWQYGVRPVAASLAALAWAFSGFFAWRGAGGHGTFLAFHYLPWILYCWRRTNDDLRYAGGVAALMGLVLLEGGTYPFPLIFLIILFDFFVQLAPPRPRWAAIRTAALTGALTLLVGAVRLWPIYRTMSRFPRHTRMEDSQTVANLLESMTAREPHPWMWGHRWVWAEYSAFVGWAVIALAAYGAVYALWRPRRWHLLAGVGLFGALAMGNVDEGWPWPLLHELPLFENFHVPSRFHVLLTFYVTLLAAVALSRGLDAVNGSTLRAATQGAIVLVAWIFVAGVAAEVLSNHVRIAARWNGPPVQGEPAERFHLVGPAGYLDSYMHYPQRNVGTPACYDPVPWNISRALWVGDRPQARVVDDDAGRVREMRRTNHTFVARVHLEQPARVVFNQNFDPDWRLSSGAGALEAVEDRGRLAVDLPAGEHRIEGRFWPEDLPWSALSTLLGLLICLALARFGAPSRLARLRRRRRGSAPLAGSGADG